MLAWALAALPVATLLMTAVNLATWRRGRATGVTDAMSSTAVSGVTERVSVLIPARNEAPRISACLAAIARSHHPIDEILVYDDESTDDTRAIVESLAASDRRIRLIATRPLPPGWVGKAHGCDRLARSASGDILLFVDADVRLSAEGLDRLVSLLAKPRCSVVTAVPRQEMGGLVERLLLPLLMVTYLSWLPLELVARSRDSRVVAANGQLLAMRRVDVATMGYFERVASEVVDDVAFCRAAKESGLRVAFADGTEMATCRMYDSARAVWEGFSKNIAEGVGGVGGTVVAIALYIATFLLAWVVLPLAWWRLGAGDPLTVAASVGVGANILQRGAIALRYRQPFAIVLAHPLAIIGLIALAIRSLGWSLRGELHWSGRAYAGRVERKRALG